MNYISRGKKRTRVCWKGNYPKQWYFIIFQFNGAQEPSSVFWMKRRLVTAAFSEHHNSNKHGLLSSVLCKFIFSGEAAPVHHSSGRTLPRFRAAPGQCSPLETLGHAKVSAAALVSSLLLLCVRGLKQLQLNEPIRWPGSP